MIPLSNREYLERLRSSSKFEEFLSNVKWEEYPDLTPEKVFTFIQTGVLEKGMPIEVTSRFMDHIRHWVSQHGHGGPRQGAGRKPDPSQLKKITLSASEEDIEAARKYALSTGKSFQQLFRQWVKKLAKQKSHNLSSNRNNSPGP